MGTIKQVIVVRSDLGMGKGKIASQVGHACVLGAFGVKDSHPDWFSEWWPGQEKVVVKVPGIRALEYIKQRTADLGLPWHEITDAGHTQVEPGTITCMSIGPAPKDLINKVTGQLKLL